MMRPRVLERGCLAEALLPGAVPDVETTTAMRATNTRATWAGARERT